MRLIGRVARFGRGGTDLYNVSKGKILMTLATNPHVWATAMDLSATTGISRASLFVLLRHWSAPKWKMKYLKRRKFGGFFYYQISLKGQEFFQRWFFLMPTKLWQEEITEYQKTHNHAIE
jgi:hypothetical protein